MSDRLDFRVLGPVRVLLDGREVALGGSKRRSLLALLVANRNRVVSVSSIADALWEDEPPPSVSSSIQVAVSGLRAALAAASVGTRALIDTAPPGYRLTVEESSCDLGRFRQLRAQARTAHSAGRLDDAADAYRLALDQWSGGAFEDLRDLRFACELAVALDEERLATVEARIEVELAAGKHRDLVGELSTLTAENPLRESLWTAYMTALFRCDRQADALAAYRVLRATLMDELGLDPSPAARTLESAVLAQDPSLAWTPPQAVQPQPLLTIREPVEIAPAQLRGEDGACYPVDGSGLQIGRLSDNGLVIDNPKVSRHHACIVATVNSYVLSDLHSTNGTKLNGELIAMPHALGDGDEIRIGDALFVFEATQAD
ncbi:MAG: BTAD domain-containing putative transcriptional regulator [Mycobacteriales bacterium]